MEKNSINKVQLQTILNSTNITTATITKGFDLSGYAGKFAVVVDCLSYNAGDFNITVQYGSSINNAGVLQNPVNLDAKYCFAEVDRRIKRQLPETINAVGQYQFDFERQNLLGGDNIEKYFAITITPTNQSGTNEFQVSVVKFND